MTLLYGATPYFSQAEGVMFPCPKCALEGKPHDILIWFDGVDPRYVPGPGRWEARLTSYIEGNEIDGLTLPMGIKMEEACGWCGAINGGFLSNALFWEPPGEVTVQGKSYGEIIDKA